MFSNLPVSCTIGSKLKSFSWQIPNINNQTLSESCNMNSAKHLLTNDAIM